MSKSRQGREKPLRNAKTAKNRIETGLDQINQRDTSHLESKQSRRSTDGHAKKSNVNRSDGPEQPDIRGKKRSRDGEVIPTHKNDKPEEEDDEIAFEDEVRALGGSHEDIELLADAQSDSEVEGTEVTDANAGRGSGKANDLDKGMNNILQEIALAQGKAEAASEPEVDEGEEDDDEQEQEATLVQQQPPKQEQPLRKGKSKLKVEPGPDWYVTTMQIDDNGSNISQPDASQGLKDLQAHAESLLQEENEVYRTERQSGSAQSFYNTVIASGTLSDKISALTLAVQESPLHNVKALESLLALSKKRSRAQAVDVLRALKDLFAQGSLLPSSRRLYAFSSQPALQKVATKVRRWSNGDRLPSGVNPQHLIVWAYENWLKDQYFEVLKTLEVWCNDEVEFAKSKALSYVYELLKEKPEQESNLLRLLVNKLGDPVKKIASQASYLLRELLQAHPAMKSIIIAAIENDFLFRPGQSLHGKYYAIVTLNQTVLSSAQEDLAVKLLDIYFSMFTTLLMATVQHVGEEQEVSRSRGERRKGKKDTVPGESQTEELREKLTSAILTGVNRAYPYTGADNKTFSEHLDTLFRIAHSANFNTGIQAMLLIQQLSATHQPSSDRFYRVLYESLLDPRLVGAAKQQMYLNLLHRSLKADVSSKRVKAFVKRILQILTLHEPSFICGAFFLLKDLDSSFPGLTALVDQVVEDDAEEEVFQDVDEDRSPADTLDVPAPVSVSAYDAHKRAPEHANADNTCAWELLPFVSHFHPSVVASAEHYMAHKKLPGKPDLTLHTLIHFLDRFVYKNAKLSDGKMHGSSIMQPLANDNSRAVLLSSAAAEKKRHAVNSEEFKAQDTSKVAAEDVFFHQYFQTLGKEPKKPKKPQHADVGDADSDDEDAVWEAMMKSAPELDMDEDDNDIGMSDLESDMGSEMEDEDDAADGQSESDVDVEAGIFDDSEVETEDAVDQDSGQQLDSDDSLINESGPSGSQDVVTETAKGDRKKDQRKRLKNLPIFASADDYAKIIEDDEGEDMG